MPFLRSFCLVVPQTDAQMKCFELWMNTLINDCKKQFCFFRKHEVVTQFLTVVKEIERTDYLKLNTTVSEKH